MWILEWKLDMAIYLGYYIVKYFQQRCLIYAVEACLHVNFDKV